MLKIAFALVVFAGADFPVQGIDVSHHQGEIDWAAVPRDKIKFVYIKATEGGDHKDSRFEKNWNEARKAGLLVGAYHYFTLCRSGKDQAKNFSSRVLKPMKAIATGTNAEVKVPDTDVINGAGILPPVVDLEFVGNCVKRPRREELEKELLDYLSAIEAEIGVAPIFYTTHEFLNRYLIGEKLKPYRIWIRDTFTKPGEVNGRKWMIWQFADRKRVPGIKEPVDMNVFAGSLKELEALAD